MLQVQGKTSWTITCRDGQAACYMLYHSHVGMILVQLGHVICLDAKPQSLTLNIIRFYSSVSPELMERVYHFFRWDFILLGYTKLENPNFPYLDFNQDIDKEFGHLLDEEDYQEPPTDDLPQNKWSNHTQRVATMYYFSYALCICVTIYHCYNFIIILLQFPISACLYEFQIELNGG